MGPFESAVRSLTEAVVLAYHGTNSKNVSSILRSGLIPDPQARVWSTDDDAGYTRPSMKTYGGIYLSTNLMTAYSAVKSPRGAIVVCRVEPKTLFADEDDVVLVADAAVGPEHLVILSYAAYKGLTSNSPEKSQAEKDFEEFRNDYATEFVRRISIKFERADQRLLNRARELALDGFTAAVLRKASHITPGYTLARAASVYGVYPLELPDKAFAEKLFRDYADRLTRTLKGLARPEIRSSSWSVNGRSLRPISFRGVNRIISVFEFWRESVLGRTHTLVEEVYGQVPSETIEAWEQAIGDWHPANSMAMSK